MRSLSHATMWPLTSQDSGTREVMQVGTESHPSPCLPCQHQYLRPCPQPCQCPHPCWKPVSPSESQNQSKMLISSTQYKHHTLIYPRTRLLFHILVFIYSNATLSITVYINFMFNFIIFVFIWSRPNSQFFKTLFNSRFTSVSS